MKTGIDVVEIARFNNIDIEKFMNRFCCNNEIEYIKTKTNKAQTLAGIYACKEAVLKAFKIGIGNKLSLKKVEIFHDNGVPYLNINKSIEKLLKINNAKEVDVNISHSENIAIAICIIL